VPPDGPAPGRTRDAAPAADVPADPLPLRPEAGRARSYDLDLEPPARTDGVAPDAAATRPPEPPAAPEPVAARAPVDETPATPSPGASDVSAGSEGPDGRTMDEAPTISRTTGLPAASDAPVPSAETAPSTGPRAPAAPPTPAAPATKGEAPSPAEPRSGLPRRPILPPGPQDESRSGDQRLLSVLSSLDLGDFPENPQRLRLDPDEALERLRRGDWLELIGRDGLPQEVKVAWINSRRTVVLLVRRPDRRALSLRAAELHQRFAQHKATLIVG
jgi:hypothetical protein